MGILYDDVVIIRHPEKEGDPVVITVNCPDKTGLGCDLCRIILFFGLSIVRGDVSTDGKWCYLVFWVVGKSTTRWGLLKKRLVGACPSCFSASGISYYSAELHPPRPPDVFLLKLVCHDRKGLLHVTFLLLLALQKTLACHKFPRLKFLIKLECFRLNPGGFAFADVTGVLCELELTIKKVKVSTTPDGRIMDLFFVTDTRELLHTNKRKEDTCDHLRAVMGNSMISCDIEMVGLESTACSAESSFLPTAITENILPLQMPDEAPSSRTSTNVSVIMDNLLSPAHTLVQIVCQDHKGLLYDIMRTLKDYNIQISYGRFYIKHRRTCEIDLFIMQADGKKIVDPNKQKALSSRLEMELVRPLRVAVVSRGPDTELMVANPVELSGKGRPLVFYDITLALKMLNSCIFSAEIRRRMIGDREFEVYRVLLDEGEGLAVPRRKIEEQVWKMLMGWEQ
ncbi:hypothetical protein SADUNF_Sadunf11G0115000 [Salix dunnii]|uniref:ACT domain-containing protein ACR n=1 Tax=Salix dunnii TaxID=1413687 RepID=A0A835MQV0_9ROSI|nr:hypothetical protein SADUNF_Sadunf11G0115000 [Salix dunnii]